MRKEVSADDQKIFHDFYERVVNKENIFFLYCTTNLLHFVLANVSFHEKKANLVLITGGLSKEEISFLNENVSIPICNLKGTYIDFCIWDLIIKTSQYNFGWLDIDCFVNNQEILNEMTKIPNNVCIQAVWKRKYEFYRFEGLLTSSYLQFVNIVIAKELFEEHKNMSMIPVVFSEGIKEVAFENYRMIESEEKKYLSRIYPNINENAIGLDTTHYFQMYAQSKGYQIRMIRELENNDHSKEIIHLGGSHRMSNMTLGINKHRFFDRFNMRYSFYILKNYCDILPVQYQQLLERYISNMEKNHLKTDIDEIKKNIGEFSKLNEIILPV